MSLIGQTIYQFKEYPRTEKYRDHWVPVVVTGETTRSWLIGDNKSWMQEKISKKDLEAGKVRGFFKTEKEVDEFCFITDHHWLIGECVRGIKEYDKLKAIADIIGYNPATKSCRKD